MFNNKLFWTLFAKHTTRVCCSGTFVLSWQYSSSLPRPEVKGGLTEGKSGDSFLGHLINNCTQYYLQDEKQIYFVVFVLYNSAERCIYVQVLWNGSILLKLIIASHYHMKGIHTSTQRRIICISDFMTVPQKARRCDKMAEPIIRHSLNQFWHHEIQLGNSLFATV